MLELTIRLVVSLAIVVGLLLLIARFGSRKFRGNSGALVHVVHRQALSRTSTVSVVTVGSRVLVLGTTEHQVSVLAELDPEELELDADELDLESFELEQPGEEVRPVRGAHLALARSLPAPRPRGSHRAAPDPRPAAQATGPLAGSVLSPQTWRQAFGARRAS